MKKYERHIPLFKRKKEDQKKLLNSSVLLIGVGGLGSFVAQHLARCGVGKIGIVDFDRVDESNLNRQILYTSFDIGENKVSTAIRHLELINPDVSFVDFEMKINETTQFDFVSDFSLIIDCTDNFKVRKILRTVAKNMDKPIIYGAVQRYEGIITSFSNNSNQNIEEIFFQGQVDEYKDKSIISPIVGIVAAMQSMEAIKILLDINRRIENSVLYIDLENNIFDQFGNGEE